MLYKHNFPPCHHPTEDSRDILYENKSLLKNASTTTTLFGLFDRHDQVIWNFFIIIKFIIYNKVEEKKKTYNAV